MLAADPTLLAEELESPAIRQLQLVREAAIEMLREPLVAACVVANLAQLIDYLTLRMGPLREEQVRAIFLNSGQRMIYDEVLSVGSIDEAPIFPRQIVARALQVGAKGVVLAHNHPSGDPTPSAADVEITRRVARALQTMEIRLHDHLIICIGGFTSMKAERLL